MGEVTDAKLYLGPRVRKLRHELGLNQTQMAGELGVSASYLNHLERNQRPLTAQMLMRFANTYDIDIRDLVSRPDAAATQDLAEVFADPMFADLGLARNEIGEVTDNHPAVAEAMTRLYRAVIDLRRMPDMIERAEDAAATAETPLAWLRERIQERHNHFAELDDAAEAIAGDLGDDAEARQHAIRLRLAERHGVEVRIVPDDLLGGALRHYDYHRRRLMLSQRLPAPSRAMGLAYQLAMIELRQELAATSHRVAPPTQATRRLLAIALCNYAAAALLMPYGRFRDAAETGHYDLDLLCARFGVGHEHVAHRLASLARSGSRGVPFFMLRIDAAGNVSKRFAGDVFPFARFGGICPRWNLHAAFQTPGRILTQIVETPDGKRYFTIARTITRTPPRPDVGDLAIGLGCALAYAPRLIYAAGRDLEREASMPIGPACRLCERRDCPERAEPPLSRSLDLSEHRRSATPLPFARLP